MRWRPSASARPAYCATKASASARTASASIRRAPSRAISVRGSSTESTWRNGTTVVVFSMAYRSFGRFWQSSQPPRYAAFSHPHHPFPRIAQFVAAYNFGRRLKTLKGLTPYEFICKRWTSEPDRFTLTPPQQTPELNGKSRSRSRRIVAGGGEVIAALGRGEGVDEAAKGGPEPNRKSTRQKSSHMS